GHQVVPRRRGNPAGPGHAHHRCAHCGIDPPRSAGSLREGMMPHIAIHTGTVLPLESIDTPILQLFRQFQAITAAAEAHVTKATGPAEDEEMDRLFWDRAFRIKDEMMSLPSTCAADFA